MKKGDKKKQFSAGCGGLSAGGFIAKILGAVYRIPLTNMLGSYGMGLYQLVFPMYSLVLTLSGVGFSMAVSKMVAARMEQKKTIEAKRVFTSALIILFILGVLNSLILLLGGDLIAKIQGQRQPRSSLQADKSFRTACVSCKRVQGIFSGQNEHGAHRAVSDLRTGNKAGCGALPRVSFHARHRKRRWEALFLP